MSNVINNKQWLTEQIYDNIDNTHNTLHYLNLLYLIVINRFRWNNLPENIDRQFIEKELFKNGELAFIRHPAYGFQICYCIGEGVNNYNRPTRYLVWTPNNLINDYYDYDSEDLVIIRNNYLSEPSYEFVHNYARYISCITKTKEINLNGQKTPYLIQCSESQLTTMKNMYKKLEEGVPVIYGNSDMDFNKMIQVFPTVAPYLLDKLQQEKFDVINECLTFMGINTTPEKKERLITDEVNANNDMTNICLSIFKNSRDDAIEEINKKFGLNVSIELSEFCKKEEEQKYQVKEGEKSGEVHD